MSTDEHGCGSRERGDEAPPVPADPGAAAGADGDAGTAAGADDPPGTPTGTAPVEQPPAVRAGLRAAAALVRLRRRTRTGCCFGVLVALVALAAPGCAPPETPAGAGGTPYFHDWLTGTVFAPAPPRALPAPGGETPAPEATPPAPVNPGAIDVLIGTPGDGHELSDRQREEAQQGEEAFSAWELDLARWEIRRAGRHHDVPRTWPHHRPGYPDVLQLVLDSPYQSWADLGSFAHLAVFRRGFAPAAGADVFLDGKHIGRTDAHGAFVFRRRPDPARTVEGGTLVVIDGRRGRQLEYQANARTQSFAFPVLYLQTDRSSYLPGDTVHVRALGWQLRGDYAPLADAPAELTLRAPGGAIVGGGALRTDDWGVATLDLPIPAHAPQGYYTLVARHGEATDQATLRIADFVPPEIDIRVDLGGYLTPDTTDVPFDVRLGYFGGGTFRGGTLRVSVVPDGDVATEIHAEERDVQGAGPHHFVLPASVVHDLAARFSAVDAPNPSADVVITATDAWGRSDTVRRRLTWTDNPYEATIELDREEYATGQPVNAMVHVTDLQDVPQRGVEVRLERGDCGEPLVVRTDDGGIAAFRFDAPTAAEAPDDAGEPDAEEPDAGGSDASDPFEEIAEDFDSDDEERPSRSCELTAFLPNVAEAAAETSFDVSAPLPMQSAVPETNIVENGDVAIEVLFPLDVEPVEDVVHADITDSSGSLVHSFLVPVVRGPGGPVARGTFRPPTWGSALLSLFCVGRRGGDVGLLTDGQSLTVRADRALTVTLHGLPERAAPGDRIDVGVDVTGPDGAPRDAIAGVAVVDRAVLSLGDPLLRSPVDRFYNPGLRVLASTGAQTLTWPVVQRTWGRDTYDIGWPPRFGYHTGGPSLDALYRAMSELTGESMSTGYGTGSGSGYARCGGRGGVGRIVLRTKFEPTSLWLPRLPVPGGHASFCATLSDAITTQNVSVVASDRQGGIGVARADVPVRQDLYVRADAPAAMVEGDRLEVPVAVRNLTDDAQQVRVSFSSADLEVTGEPQTLTVEPGATAVASFSVRARRPGEATWEASGESAALHDIERRTLRVRPRGEPQTELTEGLAAAGAPFRATVTLDPTDRWHDVRLAVTMPTVLPALQDVEELMGGGYYGADPAASQVLAAAAAWRYLAATGRSGTDDAARLHGWLEELAAAIQLGQRDDGGWAWFWDGKTNAFVTAHALDALLELRDLGFYVAPEVLAHAVGYFGQTMTGGLFPVDAIGIWEGTGERVQRSVAAYVFAVLSRMLDRSAPPATDATPEDSGTAANRVVSADDDVRNALERLLAALATRLAPELERADADPLVTAYVVLGLGRVVRHGSAGLDPGTDYAALLRGGVARLARIGDLGHGEPGWYDAYGGRVEAAYAVLLATKEQGDAAAWEAARRDAIEFLLSTRPAWGAWHNARGTAYAVRALTLLEPAPADEGGTVVVTVDGAEARRIAVRGDDLFAAALALRDVALDGLAPGAHDVEVAYDGTVRARVALAVDRWRDEAPAHLATGAAALTVTRTAPAEVDAGAPVDVAFTIAATGATGPLVLEQPLPVNARPNGPSLDALVAAGAATGWEEHDGTLVIGLDPAASHDIAFRLDTDRAGVADFPPAVVRSVLESGSEARSAAAVLTTR